MNEKNSLSIEIWHPDYPLVDIFWISTSVFVYIPYSCIKKSSVTLRVTGNNFLIRPCYVEHLALQSNVPTSSQLPQVYDNILSCKVAKISRVYNYKAMHYMFNSKVSSTIRLAIGLSVDCVVYLLSNKVGLSTYNWLAKFNRWNTSSQQNFIRIFWDSKPHYYNYSDTTACIYAHISQEEAFVALTEM